MQRVTLSLDASLVEEFDALTTEDGYRSRSEAARDLVRQAIEARRLSRDPAGFCVANLSYVYDHHTRDLAARLVEMQHDRHDIIVATLHVHLDHASCLETTVLKGQVKVVRAYANLIKAERGVRYANLSMISAVPNADHDRGLGSHAHGPTGHFSPRAG